MEYGSFLDKYAPVKPVNAINSNIIEMKTNKKKWIEISAEQKETLVGRLSLLLIWLIKEKKIQGKEIAMRLGFANSDFSQIKNKNLKMISDWKVILAAVSFGIKIENHAYFFDPDKYLGEIKTNKWDSPFFDHPLGSNFYHEEIAYFNSWYGKHEIAATEQFKKDQADIIMTGTRVHEEMEKEISESPELFPEDQTGIKKAVLGKPLADIIEKEDHSNDKPSALFNTLSSAMIEGQKISKEMQFDTSKHMPKETGDVMAKNQINLMKLLNEEKVELEEEIKQIKAKIKYLETALQPKDIRLSAINRLMDLYVDKKEF
jgi:hypothetical protein